MNWKNKLTDALGIDYPIIQAPMLGVSTPEMAAAVSNGGGLGSLPVGGLSPEATLQLIQKTKSLTSKPFAVNLFAHDVPPFSEEQLEPMRQVLMRLADKKGYKLEASDLSGFHFYTYHDQIDVLIREEIPIVSFTFGCLDSNSIQLLKDKGTILMGTATCVAEAQYLQAQGIDMICIQGIEAGGHRGTFMDNIPLPQIGLFSLLPQVTDAVQVPCIAAGSINSAKTMKAAFELGATAVQIGTAFIGTAESVAIDNYKSVLSNAKDIDTTLTKAFSGRWARGIRNEFMNEIEQSGIAIPPYPYQNSLTTKLRKLAQQANDASFTNLWSGQSAGMPRSYHSSEVLASLIKEYETRYI